MQIFLLLNICYNILFALQILKNSRNIFFKTINKSFVLVFEINIAKQLFFEI